METNIKTRMDIRNKLMILELFVLGEKTVKSPIMKEIIEYCVPRKLLETIVIEGKKGNEIHAKMEVTIDYDSQGNSSLIMKSNLEEGVFTRQEAADGTKQIDCNADETTNTGCPLWTHTIDWFNRLCQEKGLHLSWNTYFNDKHRFLWDKFGFGPCTGKTIDKTNTAFRHDAVNSNEPGLKMKTTLSKEMLSGQQFTK